MCLFEQALITLTFDRLGVAEVMNDLNYQCGSCVVFQSHRSHLIPESKLLNFLRG
jgi:hypothetical protein